MMHVEELNFDEVRKVWQTQKNIKSIINAKNENGYSALAIAAKIGSVKIMKELIKYGADVNSVNNASQSVLFIAWWSKKIESIKLLVQSGANVNHADHRGWTPLMIATSKNYTDIVEYLVQNGANVNQIDKFGKNAFDKTKGSKAFFTIASKAMTDRMVQGLGIDQDSKFVVKSPQFIESEQKIKKMIK